jgi:hypothetical protein
VPDEVRLHSSQTSVIGTTVDREADADKMPGAGMSKEDVRLVQAADACPCSNPTTTSLGSRPCPSEPLYLGRVNNDPWYDLGELAQLISRLLGHGEITLMPVLRETDRFWGGLHKPETVDVVDHWEIGFVYEGAEEVVRGSTLREAVDAALADLNRRAEVATSE